MESIVISKILAGAAALAFATALVAAGPASARSWGCYGNCYPHYGYAPPYSYAPPYGYYSSYAAYYGAYGGGPWRYRGGPHPSTGHL
jgi:hypothetical protein